MSVLLRYFTLAALAVLPAVTTQANAVPRPIAAEAQSDVLLTRSSSQARRDYYLQRRQYYYNRRNYYYNRRNYYYDRRNYYYNHRDYYNSRRNYYD